MKSPLNTGLGKLGDLTQQTTTFIKQEVKDVGKTAVSQVINKAEQLDRKSEASLAPKTDVAQEAMETKKMVDGLYGVTNEGAVPAPELIENQKKQQEMQDAQKANQLRQQLHNAAYVDPVYNRPKKQEDVEGAAERVERQEQEDMWQKQEKEKKKPKNIAVDNAEHKRERKVGAG